MAVRNFLSSVLNKVTGRQASAGSNGHQALRGDMQTYLSQQFQMGPAELANLRYVTRTDSRGPASSVYVRIFNADQTTARGVTVSKYRDLDKHQELVMFYGRINKGKLSYLKKHFVPGSRSKA